MYLRSIARLCGTGVFLLGSAEIARTMSTSALCEAKTGAETEIERQEDAEVEDVVPDSAESLRNTDAQKDARSEENSSDKRKPYVAIFLDQESREKLKDLWKRFGGRGESVLDFAHVTCVYDPREEEMKDYESIVGRTYAVDVTVVAEDENIQTAVVRRDSVSPEILARTDKLKEVWLPHLTMAVASNADPKYSAMYSSILIDRFIGAKLLSEDGSIISSLSDRFWAGVLPFHENDRFGVQQYESCAALFRPPVFPKSSRLSSSADGTKDESANEAMTLVSEMLRLTGTLCTSDRWDGTRCDWPQIESSDDDSVTPVVRDYPKGPAYIAPDEEICGFCRYMKEGPCGKVFALWEECILSCKENDTDFVDKCAQLTFDLKNCTDAEPGYYHLLHEVDTSDEEGDSAQ